jgi:hypothetical protein
MSATPTDGQRSVCQIQDCECVPVVRSDTVGVALETIGRRPINGLRHPVTYEERAITGWYIWCGEQFSNAPDFFKPLCVDHLLDALPAVADFLACLQAFVFLPTEYTKMSGSTRNC